MGLAALRVEAQRRLVRALRGGVVAPALGGEADEEVGRVLLGREVHGGPGRLVRLDGTRGRARVLAVLGEGGAERVVGAPVLRGERDGVPGGGLGLLEPLLGEEDLDAYQPGAEQFGIGPQRLVRGGQGGGVGAVPVVAAGEQDEGVGVLGVGRQVLGGERPGLGVPPGLVQRLGAPQRGAGEARGVLGGHSLRFRLRWASRSS